MAIINYGVRGHPLHYLFLVYGPPPYPSDGGFFSDRGEKECHFGGGKGEELYEENQQKYIQYTTSLDFYRLRGRIVSHRHRHATHINQTEKRGRSAKNGSLLMSY